jgi:internalin A
LKISPDPQEPLKYFVSYAWGDRTPRGQEGELIVDRLCAVAQARGITILRDKTSLGLGDRISKFMKRVGGGDRVFVVLSSKYLKSAFCMYELYEIWRNCRQDDEEFLRHVKIYTMQDAPIWTPLDRAQCAIYWREECAKLELIFKEHGFDIVGISDAQRYLIMKTFSSQIGNILATVTDILQPRNFEELERFGFD